MDRVETIQNLFLDEFYDQDTIDLNLFGKIISSKGIRRIRPTDSFEVKKTLGDPGKYYVEVLMLDQMYFNILFLLQNFWVNPKTKTTIQNLYNLRNKLKKENNSKRTFQIQMNIQKYLNQLFYRIINSDNAISESSSKFIEKRNEIIRYLQNFLNCVYYNVDEFVYRDKIPKKAVNYCQENQLPFSTEKRIFEIT